MMSDPYRADSTSPIATSPQGSNPESTPADARPAIVRAFSGPAAPTSALTTDIAVSGSPILNDILSEAPDYLNGGQPHKDPSPGSAVSDGSLGMFIQPTASIAQQLEPDDFVNADPTSPDGVSPSRRSVQFARADVVLEPPNPPFAHTRHGSWDAADASGRSRGERLISKLRSLAVTGAPQHPRPAGSLSETPLASTNTSPIVARSHRIPLATYEEGSDADAEESGDEGPRESPKLNRRKRMRRRLKNLDLRSAPNTPQIGADIDSPTIDRRFNGLVRRSTMPDTSENRGGVSEGEGRDRMAGMRRGWARGNSWIGTTRHETDQDGETPQARLHTHRRRISEMFVGGGVSDGDGLATPRRPLFGADRATTFGVQRWKQVKNTLKMLKKKRTDQFDYYKSAELMAELRAVTPAVVMFASMLQRDEHGNRRIPVLLEQLKLKVIDSQPDKRDKEKGFSDRHYLFTIALEYGSGPSRMSWTVERSLKEIIETHVRYKLSLRDNSLQTSLNGKNRPKQPHFPLKAYPWLRGVRGLGLDDEEEERDVEGRVDETVAEATAGEMTAAEGTASEMDRPGTSRRKKSHINLLGIRRQGSTLGELPEGSNVNGQRSALETAVLRRKFVEKQRNMLEKYLREMIHWLMFRADANRLCRLLELSALGVRLAAEGSYHGKECYLHIQSSKGIDFRRVLTPSKVIARHSRKWFLVRQNYIVVVESQSSMNIYDVYLVDSNFRIVSKGNKLKQLGSKAAWDDARGKGKEKDLENDKIMAGDDELSGKHHTLKIYTSERKIRLFSRDQNEMRQFEKSVTEMLKQTAWHEQHRFNSFAPVRTGVFARWLVDGRDYMWNVSRAISMAQDVIYIHDWWLSPELYMRRPPAISQKWRLDRLLQRKAKEGVKIFVIIYRNVEQAIPIDSEYTKFSLLNLHPNIMVQRSPNQLKKNQFFYAHHEKICIVDHDVAFVGGIDLCFGRWDSPQHPLADDRPTGYEPDGETPMDAEHCQLWPGKDYSNPRVLDFFRLNEPYEEMYDRSKVPRMPWHDISMQVVGQPARDLTRHFVQRWNYLRRERKPTRPIPFLLPPPDANHADLENVGLTGTCEVQILRSAGDWSLGFPKDMTEQSIQSAYVKLIEQSEHFVYIENQFFITSTETMNTRVVNRIGDALVERIIRAHENDEDWRCCIMIPLMPGFQNTVAQDSGSSVRLIMQFQYRSICRGPNSIFGRLQALNIDPEEYISFFSLRQWGKLGNNHLVTEQLYIHAKTIIVDDRVVLIGSANINERSMMGNRDSECAAIVRDTDMEWSTMAGKPYRVGRFAYSLRMRLMQEHLGLDVDEITEEERRAAAAVEAQYQAEMHDIYHEDDENPLPKVSDSRSRPAAQHKGASFNKETPATRDPGFSSSSSVSSSSHSSKGNSPERDTRITDNDKHKADVEGSGADHWNAAKETGLDKGRDSMILDGREVLISRFSDPSATKLAVGGAGFSAKDGSEQDATKGNDQLPPQPTMVRRTTAELGLTHLTQLPELPVTDDTDIGGPPMRYDDLGQPTNEQLNPLAADIKLTHIDKECMRDPVNPAFWDDIWCRVAENNTKLYRRVFRCMPDSEVLTWKDYQDFEDYSARFHESMSGRKKSDDEPEVKAHISQIGGAGAGIAAPAAAQQALSLTEKIQEAGHNLNPKLVVSPSDGKLDEKADIRNVQDQGLNKANKPSLQLSTESDKPNRPAPEAPSPVQPAGSIPFPAFEGNAEGYLDPQATNSQGQKTRDRRTTFSSLEKPEKPASSQGGSVGGLGSTRRRRRATTKGSRRGPVFPYDVLSREQAEELLGMIQGTIVQFPYDWLESEEKDSHWLYQADLLAPKEIYD
ncbi:hypothetical protein BX600DRAFT_240863 [Xylariales sp. PMI_506]|nr:hypothetical protein BX600DRAFT_240863 [Xylariales sp. PMI_506]